MIQPESNPEALDPRWRGLYRLATGAALASAVLTPLAIVVFIVWPPPYEGTVEDWFRLFRESWLLGLLSLDLLLMMVYMLLVPIFLALFFALRHHSQSWMALGTVLGLIGVVTYLASNTAVEMLDLSSRYAAATTPRSGPNCWRPAGRRWPPTRARPFTPATSSGPLRG